jgi:hypothetical protein
MNLAIVHLSTKLEPIISPKSLGTKKAAGKNDRGFVLWSHLAHRQATFRHKKTSSVFHV